MKELHAIRAEGRKEIRAMIEESAKPVPCPCGSGAPFETCCSPVVLGRRKAETAEALMRARYSAFATGAVDFLFLSNHSSTRKRLKRHELEGWSRGSEWQGLDILSVSAGGPDEAEGVVTFRARYRRDGRDMVHEERSRFEREDGEWRFVDGGPIPQVPVRREAPNVGRNDPCPCGSRKKYKKCCGA